MADKPFYERAWDNTVDTISGGVSVVVTYTVPELIYLKRAFEQSLGYVGEATTRHVGDDFREIAESIVPALLIAGGVVVTTTSLGTAIGGAIGALGAGVGAAPGAIAGAGIGFEVGMAIINFVGLASLAIYIVDHLGDATIHFDIGIRMAWNSQGDPNTIRAAAKELAEGAGVMASLIVQAVIAVVAKEGFAAACEKLGNTRLGGSITRWITKNRDIVEAQAIIQALKLEVGIKASPLVRSNVVVALKWFRSRMPKIFNKGNANVSSYMEGIDFHKMVKKTTLFENAEVVSYQIPGRPKGNYYTVRGTAPEKLGLDPTGRVLHRYRVTRPIEVLESRAAPMRYNKPKFDMLRKQVDPASPIKATDRTMFSGGAKQFTVADMDLGALELIPPGTSLPPVKPPTTTPAKPGLNTMPGMIPVKPGDEKK